MGISAYQITELKNTDGWVKQILYWRTHLDVFIEEYFKIKLKDTQKVMARAFGNCEDLQYVQSRGYGKTWLIAVCCLAMGVLYPGSNIAVISGTAEQAVLVLKKIDEYFARVEDIRREIDCDGRRPVSPLTRNKGLCVLKNGSRIESFSIGTFRGNRAKVIVVDEAPEVKKVDLEEVARPVRNATRSHCIQKGIKDYPSKIVSITSACLKSNYFYEAFVGTLQKMARGDLTCFACALDYQSAARVGISPMSFFEKEKRDMPETSFAMEYGSIFLGAEANSMFPFELTDRARRLTEIEVAMPAKSTADYVMGVDLATSSARTADNAVITIIKLVELEDGNYLKKLVYIRSFHGKRLDALAAEVRRLLVKFPNVIKVVFDYRGLGDAFPQFMSQPWTDPETNKEYPPLVIDTEETNIRNAVPLLSPVVANIGVNQQIISALTVAFEKDLLEIPVNSRHILGNQVLMNRDDDEDEEGRVEKKLTTQEKAVFIEADALQIELGNVVSKETSSGAIIYDVAKSNQHKDRYSSLGMAVRYIAGIEEVNRQRLNRANGTDIVGVYTVF